MGGQPNPNRKMDQKYVFRRQHLSSSALALLLLVIISSSLFLLERFPQRSLLSIFRPSSGFDLEKCHLPELQPPAVDGELWKANRVKTLKYFNQEFSEFRSETVNRTAIVVHGRRQTVGNEGVDFVQFSDFFYLSGVLISEASILIDAAAGRTLLFLNRQSSSEIAFEGQHPDPASLRSMHGVADILLKEDLASIRKSYQNIVELSENTKDANGRRLRQAIDQARREKSDREIEMIEYATRIAAGAHKELMVRASSHSSEFSLLALFKHLSFLCGCRVQAYSPIVGARDHAAVLHYQGLVNETASNQEIGEGLVLVDASGSYHGYASDVTRTFSTGRRFTEDMRRIYQIVLDANMVGISMVRPGVRWSTITTAARLKLLEGLQREGLVSTNVTVGQLSREGIHQVFMPHGLGHTVGVEVHDVQPFDWTLQARDILTVEPGVYFNRPIFEAARSSLSKRAYINWQMVDRLLDMNFGGVRIEDVVLVTELGHRVLSSDAPKTVEELEGVSKSFWPFN